MREFYRGVCGVVFLFALVGTAIGFIPDDPKNPNMLLNFSPWKLRIGVMSGAAVVISLGALVMFELQKDKVPDFLYQTTRSKYCDSDGFCYALNAGSEDGVCILTITFQNRYDKAVQARLALRAARGFLGRPSIPIMGIDIACPAAGFGIARIACDVPRKYQGTYQTFELGADVRYPAGRGRQLRYRHAIPVRSSVRFGNAFASGLTVAGLVGGAIVISTPATVRLLLPTAVAESAAEGREATVAILWKLGDAVPAETAAVEQSG